MTQGKIHFQNTPFAARILSEGPEPVTCTPVVYDEPLRCGIGILYGENSSSVWGLMTPRNLITAWRATEVLRRLDSIERTTLCSAYYTAKRNPTAYEMLSFVTPTIEKIGRAAHDEIMAMPVPEQIVRAVLDNQRSERPPMLYSITEELHAGTLSWRQEFANAGIKRPSDDARMREVTLAQFDSLLESYAKMRNMQRGSLGMDFVEAALLDFVERGMNKKHPNNVLVALAGMISNVGCSDFSLMLQPFDEKTNEERAAYVASATEEAARQSAAWLASNPKSVHLAFWKRPKDAFSRRSAIALLTRLFGEYTATPPTEAACTTYRE